MASTIHRRPSGLPFYLEELAAAIAEAGADAGETASAEAVPESVRDAVLSRVARLSEPARAVAEMAAVAGSPVPLDVLAELAEDEAAVDELVEIGLLVEHSPATRGPAEVAFRHALVGRGVVCGHSLDAASPPPRCTGAGAGGLRRGAGGRGGPLDRRT